MKQHLIIRNTLKFLSLFLITLLFGQCKKDDTLGVITVVFAGTETVVPNAEVKLYIDSDEESGMYLCDYGYVKEQIYTTNSSGVIKQCFTLPALVSVEATFSDLSGTYIGEGKLNLMEHETTSVTIKLN